MGHQRRHTGGFCDEAILMVAGLIQLPTMIASVVGVRGTKTPSQLHRGCATIQVGSLFETGGWVSKAKF